MSAKLNDPAKALEYFRRKMDFTTGPVELNRMIEQHNGNINIVDVRAAEDYAQGHVPGAITLPEDRWTTLAGLKKDKLNILYCYTQQCHLAANAAVNFASHGFPVMEMNGGFEAWQEAELPTERGMPMQQAA